VSGISALSLEQGDTTDDVAKATRLPDPPLATRPATDACRANGNAIGYPIGTADAGVTGLEPATCGFGDRCSAN
jgi:hypothetical protein